MNTPNIESNYYRFLRHILKFLLPFVPGTLRETVALKKTYSKYIFLYKLYRLFGGAQKVIAKRFDGKLLILSEPDFERIVWGVDHKRFNKNNFYPLIRKFVLPGSVAIDVGAAFGDETLDMADFVGKDGKVYAFEPEPRAFECLKETLSLNKIKNAEPYELAVGAKEGEIRFDEAITAKSVKNIKIGKTLRVISLSDFYFEKIYPKKVSFLKIDTEGFDLDVLQGAKDLIKHNPDIKIVMEFLPAVDYSGKKGTKVIEHLFSHDFEVSRIQTSTIPLIDDNEINYLIDNMDDQRHMISHDLVISKKK